MFFVFDVESIPDYEFIKKVLESPPSEDPEEFDLQMKEELGRGSSGFLPPMYHRMVSWVGLWIANTGEPKHKVAWSGEDEKEGLNELITALNTYKDFGLIHHNGRGFDIPLITYRCLKHGLQLPLRMNKHEIRYRYSRENIDLQDEFSNYGASSWPKLKHIGALIDMPFKQTGQGDEVHQMFKEGRFDDIERYCYEDVMATYLVWLHLKYTVADMNREQFDNLKDRAVQKLQEIQESHEAQ